MRSERSVSLKLYICLDNVRSGCLPIFEDQFKTFLRRFKEDMQRQLCRSDLVYNVLVCMYFKQND